MDRVFCFLAKRSMDCEEQEQIEEKIHRCTLKRNLRIKHRYVNQSFGIFIVSSGPSKNADFSSLEKREGLISVAVGYLYNREKVLDDLTDLRFGNDLSDADIMAKYSLEASSEIVEKIQGQFTLFRFDIHDRELLIVTDRYGLTPLYFCQTKDHYIYSHDLRLIVDVFPIARVLDRLAAAQLISMGLVYDNRTLIESIERVPNGTILRCQTCKIVVSQYWDYPFQEQTYLSSRNQILELINLYLERAIKVEFSKAPGLTAVALSGGMDSRTIVAYAQRQVKDPLKVFTVGTKCYRSRERKYAQELAKMVKAQWDFEDQSESLDVSNQWPDFVEWTGGWQNVHQSWTFPGYQNICVNKGYQRVLSGYAFDVQLSLNPTFALLESQNLSEIVDGLLNNYGAFRSALVDRYFSNEFSRILKNEIRVGLEQRICHLKGAQSWEIADYFFWNGRAKGYTVAEGISNSRTVNLGMPFLEHDVFDLCMKIPPKFKLNRKLHFELFVNQFPQLRSIPYAGTGVPIDQDPRFWQTVNRMLDKGEYYLNRLTLGRLERSPISGPAWFRHSNTHRDSILSLMNDQLGIEERIITAEGYKRLIKDIEIGKNYAYGLLERIATVELCLKQFIHG